MRARATAIAAALALAVGTETTAARAEPPQAQMRFDPDLDVTVSIFAGSAWLVTEIDKRNFAPDACRICDRKLDGLDASARKALLWKSPETAASLSNITVFGVAPMSALGLSALAAWHDHRQQNIPADALLIVQASLLAMDLNQLTKYVTGRARPYVRFGNRAVLDGEPDPYDANLSFFSGHTTAAFALAASSGTVATLRHYRWAPWVWAQGLAIGLVSGYLRIAADRHYLTDVLTGAVMGAAVGFAVPFLHRPGRSFTIGPVAGPGLGIVGTW
ncbi:phosphoesterase PA-phosphatase related protein [Minicystis rosea]|nr:phosphoesterase PA-phosphatase related protein [Minicystis rosea]